MSTLCTNLDVPSFRAGFGGDIVTPGDDGYDAARAVWNGTVDAHPALIARCHSTEHIVQAVGLARSAGTAPAVRAGGHSVPGLSMCDGVVIDLSQLRDVRVDPDRRVAVVQPGATWADFDAATAAHGLASTGGLISTTGVAGLTLRRQHRLAATQVRTGLRQPDRRRIGDCKRRRPARRPGRTYGAVVGAARRRRELRRGVELRVHSASGLDDPRRTAAVPVGSGSRGARGLPDVDRDAARRRLHARGGADGATGAVRTRGPGRAEGRRHQMGGAVARVGDEAAAVGNRNAAYAYNLVSTWVDPSEDGMHVDASRVLAAALQPLSTGGAYVNFLGDEGTNRIRAAYGDTTYERLAQLKREPDPDNMFRRNQNIPATS